MFVFNDFFIKLVLNRMFTTLSHYEVIMDDTIIMVCKNRLRSGFILVFPFVNLNCSQNMDIGAF